MLKKGVARDIFLNFFVFCPTPPDSPAPVDAFPVTKMCICSGCDRNPSHAAYRDNFVTKFCFFVTKPVHRCCCDQNWSQGNMQHKSVTAIFSMCYVPRPRFDCPCKKAYNISYEYYRAEPYTVGPSRQYKRILLWQMFYLKIEII